MTLFYWTNYKEISKGKLLLIKLFSLSHEELLGRKKAKRQGVNVSLIIKFRTKWIRGKGV